MNTKKKGIDKLIISRMLIPSYGNKLVLLMTNSPVGGLPVAGFFTPSESTDCLTAGLEMLKEKATALKESPIAFMTDHCDMERSAIAAVFPDSKRLLCSFHLLQAFWNRLWDHKHGIQKDDCQVLNN